MDHHHGHGCGCHHGGPPMRMCRRDSRELLVEDTGTTGTTTTGTTTGGTTTSGPTGIIVEQNPDALGTKGRAIIGGGCCVSLSVEYMPSNPSLSSSQVATVDVAVTDSAGTAMLWSRGFKEGYHVQECIITTNPGAVLTVVVKSAIARVRWCEVFSC